MTQIAQLSEAEIDDRFQVSGTRPVAFMLAGFAREREQFSVQFDGQTFLSTLLGVDVDKARLIVDCSGSPELNRRFREADRATLVGRPGGIHVQFSTGGPQEINYQGAKAFSVPLPTFSFDCSDGMLSVSKHRAFARWKCWGACRKVRCSSCQRTIFQWRGPAYRRQSCLLAWPAACFWPIATCSCRTIASCCTSVPRWPI